MFLFQQYIKTAALGTGLLALSLVSTSRSHAQDVSVNVKHFQIVNGSSPSVTFDVYLSASATYVSNVAGNPNLGLQNVDVAFEVDFGTDGTAAAGTTSPVLATGYASSNLQSNINSITGANLSGAMQTGYDSRFKFNLDRVLGNTQLTTTPTLAGTFTVSYPNGTVIGTVANGAKLSIRTTTGGTGSKWSDFLGNTGQTIGTNSTFATPAPLPVKLVSFTAHADKCDVSLNWTTANEKDVDHYDVEYSKNGNSFDKVGTVRSVHNSSGSSYAFNCSQLSGQGYYRLSMVDMNGSYTVSNVVTIRTSCNGGDNIAWNIYPNPVYAGGNFNLKLNAVSGLNKAHIVISDLQGRKVFEKEYPASEGVNLYKVPTDGWSAGSYLVSVYDENKKALGVPGKLVIME